MDDIRSKQRKPDDPRYIGIVFADGSGKFVDIGKLAFIDQCLLQNYKFRLFLKKNVLNIDK